MSGKIKHQDKNKPGKKLFLLFMLILIFVQLFLLLGPAGCRSNSIDSIKFPEHDGYVNDYTQTLSADTIRKTESLVTELRQQTSCELAIVMINDLEGMTIEKYASGLFSAWGIGKKESDNGVLLLVALKEKKLRIEVGYGLEETVTDLKAKDIIENIIAPEFKANDYDGGIYNGATAIANIIYEKNGIAAVAYEENSKNRQNNEPVAFPYITLIVILANILPWLTLGIVFGSFMLKKYIKKHRCPKCGHISLDIKTKILSNPSYEYSGRAEVDEFCRKCGYRHVATITLPILLKNSYSGSSYSSGHSFSSGSSSFGSSSHSSSFGGGSSGGGGASGSW
ncbi:MAG: TPM domain-containing protein [Actinobacteria bacterium]|nr:TPM domain-containing protein [Actinomycetota bacterium]